MNRKVKVVSAALLSALFIIGSCFAEETLSTAGLIEKAKISIQHGNKEEAVASLDAAFESANSAGDYSALMDIGDLYMRIDPSLKDKAMASWTAAGQWKCR